MPVDDLWYKRGPADPVTGKPTRVESARHGRGKRWRARWVDDTGATVTSLHAKRADAERAERDAAVAVDRGTYVNPRAGRMPLSGYVETYLGTLTTDPSSREATRLRFRVHIVPHLGEYTLSQLHRRPSLIKQWAANLSNAGMSPTYVRTIFTALSGCLMAAVDDKLIPSNPCAAKSVKPPAPDRRRVAPWPRERVNAVQGGLPDRFAAMVDCGAGLGLRQGEVLGLAVDDIDWLRRVVHVRRQVKIVGSRLVFAPPKRGKERDVPLSESVSLRLAAHVESVGTVPVTLPWKDPAGEPTTVSLLFTTASGGAIDRTRFNRSTWKQALAAAGVIATPERVKGQRVKFATARRDGFHALRHYFASALLANGVDVRTLAEYLGHDDPGFTLRVYSHLMPSAADRARQAIDAAIGAPSSTPENPRVVPDLYPERS
jgi:integrase